MLKLKLQFFGHLMQRANSLERPWQWGRLKVGGEGTTEDEVAGWHHRLNDHELEQAPGDGEGQGSLACCSPWGCKESDTTEQLNNNWIVFLEGKKSSWTSTATNTTPGRSRFINLVFPHSFSDWWVLLLGHWRGEVKTAEKAPAIVQLPVWSRGEQKYTKTILLPLLKKAINRALW